MNEGTGAPETFRERSPAPLPATPSTERLWTPWRMRYVGGGTREDGCIFCNRLSANDDVQSLILHRGERAFVIMNLFPYNTGHVMIVPNAHISSPEDADDATMADMSALRTPVLRALRRALGPAGFNLGINVGAVAGAGVTDHLHEHVVPRWEGDANFMSVLASTKVMPELIPITYAKLRAELARELASDISVYSVVVTDDGSRVLVDEQGRLPRAEAEEGEPIWRAALRDTRARGVSDAELVGWAGSARAGDDLLALRFRSNGGEGNSGTAASRIVPIDTLLRGPDAALMRYAQLPADPAT